ncbi:GNAT family N-acetyltransferase [Paenibacillus sp. FJAT-26967]|uniref:GNAT family N-acetyltransferase n=1 Tax=Paenibacillus sp. FJAT-26967 TaxID=1729690 RepID=UPI000837BB43|nr:GNAT family N-acetyltransferase [Paenibacillus sp. FJAT-26967]
MTVEIRVGHREDFNDIMELLARCIKVMQDGGSDQWDNNYPNRDVIGEDLLKETLYIAEREGQILGMVVLDEHPDEQYQNIFWKQAEGPHLIMHRLAVDPKAQGQGIARRLVEFAEDHARRGGFRSIRLDTYSKNTAALKLYQGLNYDRRGEVIYPGRVASFQVFEKVLT